MRRWLLRLRLLPDTLFGRLVVLLAGGLALALAASAAIHLHDRGEALYLAGGMNTARRFADMVRLLDPMSEQDRHKTAAVLENPLLGIRFSREPFPPPTGTADEERAAYVHSLLSHYLHEAWPLKVWVTDLDPPQPAPSMEKSAPATPTGGQPRAEAFHPRGGGMPGQGRGPPPPGQGMGYGGGPGYMRQGFGPGYNTPPHGYPPGFGPPGRGKVPFPGVPEESANQPARIPLPGVKSMLPQGIAFVAQVRFLDDTWAEFHSRLPNQLFDWPERLSLSLLILLATLAGVSLVAVGLVTRPLKALGEAAQALGRDLHHAPLAVTGPREVRRTALAFNTMQARLVRYIQERTHLLAALSHDLKTPITRLRLRAELMEDAQLREKILGDLNEMEEMAAASLDFIRGMEGAEELEPVEVSAMLEAIQAEQEELGRRVTLACPPLPPVPLRPLSVKRCLVNLLNNAAAYGGSADITAGCHDNRLRITVSDHGPGIPAADLERVFDPFVRLEGSRNRRSGGAGLGLSIARNIARAHGGELTLSNHPQGGLVATLELPMPPA